MMTEPNNKKDKACPFCHQQFTASSLGRHLDTFIKDKSPKAADDVHNVEDIRRLRAGITRRQPRQSLRRRTPLSGDVSPAPSDDRAAESKGAFRTYLNQPGWEATGVINESSRASFIGPRGLPNGCAKDQLGRKEEDGDLADRARAAELALQEVLESLRLARLCENVDPPFDFNFHALNLPQLYLRCLEPPQALLSKPSRQLGVIAWTVQPPSILQCEDMRAWLAGKISDWKRRHENSQGQTTREDALRSMKREEAGYYDHLEKSFTSWTRLSDTERSEIWHLECARALALEKEAHSETKEKLEKAESEIKILGARLEDVALGGGRADWASGAIVPPLSRHAVTRLGPPDELDYSALISKWKTRIQSARSDQHPLPIGNGTSQVNGHTAQLKEHPRTGQTGLTRGQEDTDLEDAEGELDSDPDVSNDASKAIPANGKGRADDPLLNGEQRLATAMELG